MNVYFNFRRIRLLAIRYLAEHRIRDSITLAAYFVALMFIPRLITGPPDLVSFTIFCFILSIGGARYTARIFHELHTPAGGLHYLHIPASQLEKFLFNGVLSLLFYPLACIVVYYGGTFIGNLLEPIMPSFLNYRTIELSSLFPSKMKSEWISTLLFNHAIFFLGSLFFRKHPTTKTFLSIITFGIAVLCVEFILIKIVFGEIDPTSNLVREVKLENLAIFLKNSPLLQFLNVLVSGLVLLYLWFVSYLKLKEKQV